MSETGGTFTIAEAIRRQAAAQGDRPAITFGEQVVSFAELDRRSSRLAQALQAAGVQPQDRVARLDKNGIDYFDLLFGCAKLNAVAVDVNWRLAPAEIAHVLRDAEAKVLLVGAELAPQIKDIEADLGLAKVVTLGPEYDEWVGGFPADDPGVAAAPDDVAWQLYTSGTTGVPKGAMLTNANLAMLEPTATQFWGFTPEAVNLVVMPLFHIAGGGWGLVGVAMGCHSILMREFDPAAVLKAIPEHRVTHALFVPAVLQFLCSLPGVDDVDVSSLEYIVYGASPISEAVLQRSREVFGAKFVQAYGMTETTGGITLLLDDEHDTAGDRGSRLRSCGRPLPWNEVRIVDPESGADVPAGEVGEVWIRSVQNMKGYWRNDEATAQTITADGWLRTGDAGYLDGDGFLYLHDRVKDMVVSGGENVYPAEVENVLMAHPAVADVAVIGVPDEKWGETVKAIVVRKPDTELDPADLIAFSRERLAHYKCPTSVDFADALPRNPSGKVLKKDLREPYWAGKERRVH